jgi:hypothetical protein
MIVPPFGLYFALDGERLSTANSQIKFSRRAETVLERCICGTAEAVP